MPVYNNLPKSIRSVMAKLLFKLNGVSEEEANEIRELLDEHDVEYYETHSGRWGISLAAVWIKNNDQFESARELILASQRQRQISLRTEFEKQRLNGEIPDWRQRLRERPIDFIAVGLAIAFILGIMLWPFLTIFE